MNEKKKLEDGELGKFSFQSLKAALPWESLLSKRNVV